VRVIGEKEGKYMKEKKYTSEPIGKVKVVKDFLPSPNELVLKEDAIRVTLMLSKKSINYFKQEAEKQHAHYQSMIRALLDKYAQHYTTAKHG
jgi:predicted DNA binding CopG/RHH family protein